MHVLNREVHSFIPNKLFKYEQNNWSLLESYFFSPNRQKVKHKSISYAAAVEIKALKGRKKFVRQGDNFYKFKLWFRIVQ